MNRKNEDIVGKHSLIYYTKCKKCYSLSINIKKNIHLCSKCKQSPSQNKRTYFEFTFYIFEHPKLFDLNEFLEIGPYHSIKNPWGLVRDHKVSIFDAIKNNYDPYYISHPVNCELMTQAENQKKYTNSSIAYKQLVKEVNTYDNN